MQTQPKTVSKTNLKLSEVEKKYLVYIAALPYNSYAFEELVTCFEIKNQESFFDYLHELTKQDWLIREENRYRFKTPLIRTIARTKFKPTFKDLEPILVYFGNLFFPQEGEDYTSKVAIVPFIVSFLELLDELDANIMHLAFGVGMFYYTAKDKRKALPYYLRAIHIGEHIGCSYLSIGYHYVASIYYDLKQPFKALDYSIKFVNMRHTKAQNKSDLQELNYHYYKMAVYYYDMVDFFNAKRYIDKVVELDKLILEENHPDIKFDLKLQKRIHRSHRVSSYIQQHLKKFILTFLLALLTLMIVLTIRKYRH